MKNYIQIKSKIAFRVGMTKRTLSGNTGNKFKHYHFPLFRSGEQTGEHSIYNKKLTLGLFLDIEGAFSNITYEAISDALRDAHVEDNLI